MSRFLLYTASVLCLSGIAAIAADRYGEWLLEQPRSSVLTLSFKRSVPLNNKIATSELGFVCDQKDKNVGVILIPFDGTFESHQNVIPVSIQKSDDQYDPSDLLQKWTNGTEYIFLESKDDIDVLASFLRTSEHNGVKSVHFFFPNDPHAGHQITNHTIIYVPGFSDGFDAFHMACASSQ